MTSASLLQSYSSSLWSLSSLTLGWMICVLFLAPWMLWERRNITRNAVCRLKPEPRSLDISPQQVCWTQRWGDNTKCFAGKKTCILQIHANSQCFKRDNNIWQPNAWAICFIDLPKAQPWTFARLMDQVWYECEIGNSKIGDSFDSLDFQRIQNQEAEMYVYIRFAYTKLIPIESNSYNATSHIIFS